jgi:hypothetical protein
MTKPIHFVRRFNPRVPLAGHFTRRFNPRIPLAGFGDDASAAADDGSTAPDGVTCIDLQYDQAQPPSEDSPMDGSGTGDSDQPDPTPPVDVNGITYLTFPRGIQNWENIDQDNYVLLGAIGTTVTIISYVVPPGRNGVIYKVANNFVGGGWVEGTGDVIWRILVDGAPPPGATSYNSILASLGNPASPTEIPGFRIFENQVLTLVAFNNPAGPDGGVIVAGQRVGARFVGWNYPTDIEANDVWI